MENQSPHSHKIPSRLESFSDAVIAIVLTIMVLELRVPVGNQFSDLRPLLPIFLSYALSFANIITYWNNHHHLLKTMHKPTAAIMWTNALLLFCLSLIPFTSTWLGGHPGQKAPTITYGFVFLAAALAYTLLERTIIAAEGKDSLLARALGSDAKGKISLSAYILAILAGFYIPWISYVLFTLVAFLWMLPDSRIVAQFKKDN